MFTEVTTTFLILKRRNSCATPPLLWLRAVSVPSEMCLPSALRKSNSGEARSTNFWIERSLPFTLPAPPPPPVCGGSSDSPQLHASTSISPLCLASTDSTRRQQRFGGSCLSTPITSSHGTCLPPC